MSDSTNPAERATDAPPLAPSPTAPSPTAPSATATSATATSATATSATEGSAPVPIARPPRAGELSLGWRIVTAFTWIGVTMALAAVWNASVQLGLSTWWLGPRAEPRPLAVRLSPFVAPVLMLLGTINHARWLGWFGLASSGLIAAVGIADLGYVSSLAAVELVIAGAAAAVSIASFAGTYRHAEPTAAAEAATEIAPSR